MYIKHKEMINDFKFWLGSYGINLYQIPARSVKYYLNVYARSRKVRYEDILRELEKEIQRSILNEYKTFGHPANDLRYGYMDIKINNLRFTF